MAVRKTKWMNDRDSKFDQYQICQNDYRNNILNVENCSKNKESLIYELQTVEEKTRNENADEIKNIDQKINEESESLRTAEIKLDYYKEGFDENNARKEAEDGYRAEFEQSKAGLIENINGLSSKLSQIYRDREAMKTNSLSEIQKLDSIENLRLASKKGYLSDVINRPYDKDEAMYLCKKNNLNDCNSFIRMLSELNFPKYLNQFIPNLNIIVLACLVVLFCFLYSVMTFSSSGVADASAGLTNGIFVFVQKLIHAVIGALIGAAVGAIIGFIVDSFLGTGLLLKGGAIFGGVVGLLIGFGKETSELSYEAGTVAGNVGRVITIIVVSIVMALVIVVLDLHDKVSEILIRKVPRLRDMAHDNLSSQTNAKPWMYYLSLYADTVSNDICDNYGSKQEEKLFFQKKELEEQLAKIKIEYEAGFEDNINRIVREKEKNFLADKSELERIISEIREKISSLEREGAMRRNDLDRLVKDKKEEIQKKIQEEDRELDRAKQELGLVVNNLNENAEAIMSVRFMPLSETKGHISENIYLEVKDKDLAYRVIRRIAHNYMPILFLYKGEKDGLKNLYPLVEDVARAFFQNNSLEVINLNLVDVYNGGIELSGSKLPFHIFDKRNVGDFNADIENTVRFVASAGETWNDVIGELVATTGVIEEERRAQISFIIVPPEGSGNVSGFEELPSLVRNGKKRGFIPIFFMSEEEYKNYDPEKSSQKYIMEIFSSRDSENYIYRYDLKEGTMTAG